MSLDPFVLLRVDHGEVAGVSASVDQAEQAVVTVQSQGVYLYNIYDQKCVTSWLFGPSSHFEGPAHQLISKSFVAVQDKKFIVTWHESDVKLQNMARRTYENDSEIAALVVDKQLGNQFILVFSTGVVGVVSAGESKLAHKLSLFEGKDMQLVSVSSGKRSQNNLGVMVLAVENNSLSGSYVLYMASCVHSAHEGVTLKQSPSHVLPSHRPERIITSCCFDASTHFLTALWDDGLLEFFQINGGAQGLSTKNSFQRVHQLPLNIYATNLAAKLKSQKPAKKSKKSNDDTPLSALQNINVTTTPVADGHVVVGGPRDENNANCCLLTVWDTQYGLVQLHKELHLPTILESSSSAALASDSTHKSKSKHPQLALRQALFSSDKNVLLLNFGQAVLACPIYIAPSSLAQVLGGQATTDQFLSRSNNSSHAALQYDYAPTHDATVPIPNAGYVKISQAVYEAGLGSQFENEQSAIDLLSDRSKTPDYSSFMEVFNQYVASTTEDASKKVLGDEKIERSQSVRARPGHKKWKNLEEYNKHENALKAKQYFHLKLQGHIDFSPVFVQAVVTRCLQEDFLWFPLRKLIEYRCVSLRANPNLLTVLKAHNRLDLISAALSNISDISELEIVGIVHWLVNQVDKSTMQIFVDEHVYRKGTSTAMEVDDSSDQKNGDKSTPKTSNSTFPATNNNTGPASWQSAMDCLLNMIVNLPLNESFLRYCMQLFTLKDMVAMIRYLLSWFDHCDEFTEPARYEENSPFSLPSLSNAVLWTNAIIDSHLGELILVPECSRLLKRLNEAVVRAVQLHDALSDLHSCLSNYFDHDPTPRDAESEYSIELLRL